MRQFKILATALGAALLVAACGGGGGDGDQSPKIKFTSMVSFGDSLSDVGTYKVGGVLNATGGGGMYTINSASSKNWTELIAAQLQLPAPCPAQTGLDGTGIYSVMPPVNHAGCLNYAQGGSRVTIANGPHHKSNDPTLGQLTVPVSIQITNHLATTVSGNFSGTELITVLAGANDVLMNLAAIAPTVAFYMSVAGGSQDQVTATTTASTAAVTAMGTAGAQMAAYINTQMVAKGAKYIAVVNVPDVSKTPFAYALSTGTQGLINLMVTTFNTQLQTGLTGKAGVIIVDAYSDNRNQAVNPASYALTNVTDLACNLASPTPNALGGSLVCNAGNLNSGDVSHYLFADSVHPTPYGYTLLAQLVAKSMALAHWL